MGPMTLGGIYATTLRIVSEHRHALTQAVLSVLLPVWAVTTVIKLVAGAPDDLPLGPFAVDRELSVGAFADSLLTFVAAIVALGLAVGACYRLVASACGGMRSDAAHSLALVSARVAPAVGLATGAAVAITAGLLFCILPGLWLAVALVCAMPALLAERLGPGAAASRSIGFVRGHELETLGRVASICLLGAVAAGIVSLIVYVPLQYAFGPAGTAQLLSVQLAVFAGAVVVLPYMASFLTLIYFDLRARAEGVVRRRRTADSLLPETTSVAPPADPDELGPELVAPYEERRRLDRGPRAELWSDERRATYAAERRPSRPRLSGALREPAPREPPPAPAVPPPAAGPRASPPGPSRPRREPEPEVPRRRVAAPAAPKPLWRAPEGVAPEPADGIPVSPEAPRRWAPPRADR